jgi:hypothetical protein
MFRPLQPHKEGLREVAKAGCHTGGWGIFIRLVGDSSTGADKLSQALRAGSAVENSILMFDRISSKATVTAEVKLPQRDS